jgi:hypothetical protein
MRILDNEQLIPDHAVLDRIVRNHPFSKNLAKQLDTIVIELSEQAEIAKEKIEYDDSFTNVRLGVGRDTAKKGNYEYILYHEFGHAADRLNPEFGYS